MLGSSSKHECWMCGFEWDGVRWQLDVNKQDEPRPSFAVTLCLECAQLIMNLAERVRVASRQSA